jgi:hypothetical protein
MEQEVNLMSLFTGTTENGGSFHFTLSHDRGTISALHGDMQLLVNKSGLGVLPSSEFKLISILVNGEIPVDADGHFSATSDTQQAVGRVKLKIEGQLTHNSGTGHLRLTCEGTAIQNDLVPMATIGGVTQTLLTKTIFLNADSSLIPWSAAER